MEKRIDSPALTIPGVLKALREPGSAVKQSGVPDTTLARPRRPAEAA